MKSWKTISLLAVLLGFAMGGCMAPIGADHVTTRRAYEQVESNALRTGQISGQTMAILHRYTLDELAAGQPDLAVRYLHERALETGERDLLFALSELSYAAGENIRRSVKPWDRRDARDYYLGSAVYAWLFLFGEGKQAQPGAFDRRFRDACDLYNFSLGLALAERRDTNAMVRLETGRRNLPVGQIVLQLDTRRFPAAVADFDYILLADVFRVRGLTVRNREAGLGAPLICVSPVNPQFKLRPCTPATAVLRGPASLRQLASQTNRCALELYLPNDADSIVVGGASIPLEADLTTSRAYALNQSRVWRLGRLDFLAPAEHIPNQLLLNQVFDPQRIPVVFVHGTFSSPVTWAEMANTLTADPVLRRHYQLWSFIYGSGNPIAVSMTDLRASLTTKVEELDPQGTNRMLRQMVIIGHSQGGLLTKGTAIQSGDRLWRMVSTNRLEDLKMPEDERVKLKQMAFYEPLPFVKRVIFIATPHRGSYLSSRFARRLGRKLVSLPHDLVSQAPDIFKLTRGSEMGEFLEGRLATSLDGMSPKNPALLELAEIPVVPEIKAHSIIPVLGQGDPKDGGRDGVVAYSSAHVVYVESEFIVRAGHSCLDHPSTIEEVRRILHEHLAKIDSGNRPGDLVPLGKEVQ